MDQFVAQHSGALTIMILCALVLATLSILVPKLLNSHQHTIELNHAEHMRALEQGLPVQRPDERSVFAGRTALLVPMVSICTAGTVTCFVVAYQSENLLSVTLGVWCVAGVVSLVRREWLVEANGRMQASYSATSVVRPAAAGGWASQTPTLLRTSSC